MEIVFMYFWIIKLTSTALGLLTIYKLVMYYYNTGKYHKGYLILVIVLAIISLFSPIRINGTNSKEVIVHQNTMIEVSKVLPNKVEDTSFNYANTSIKGISKEDINLKENNE